MNKRSILLLAGGWLLGAGTLAAAPSDLPAYRPTRPMQGVIRSWGHGFLRPAMKRWEDGYRRFQPGVRFEDNLITSAAAIAGLYTRRTDLGVLAREIMPAETAAYEKMTGQKLCPVTVMTGSYGNQDKIMALGIFVSRDNPIAGLSFAQLDAIWGCELRGGAPAQIRTWDQLGLRGEWEGKLIRPYTGLVFEAPCWFFAQKVMKGSALWNGAVHQFENVEEEQPAPDAASTPIIHRSVDAYQKAVDAVGMDRFAIGLSGAGYRHPNAKLVAVADPTGRMVAPTRENVANLTYPLARPVRFYINNGPRIPADPNVVEFLRYVLSRQGQDAVQREGDFLPLPADAARHELNQLPSTTSFSP